MGVYNNNKDGTRSTLANTIQVVDAPMEQFLSRGEFSAVTPNDVSADNKLVAENEVTKAVDTMPTASSSLVGTIVQYIGTTTANYTNGYFYKCVSDGAVTPTYSWVEVISGGGDLPFVTPEQFGAKGDGVTDDTEAFTSAFAASKNVICDGTKTYYFAGIVDASDLTDGDFNINNATLLNFHIKVGIKNTYEPKVNYPYLSFKIHNGNIGTYSAIPANWQTPAIQTGNAIDLDNIVFKNTPYIVALTNSYRDYNKFRNLTFDYYSTLWANVASWDLDAISLIASDGSFVKINSGSVNTGIPSTTGKFSGDGWIIENVCQFISKKYTNYGFCHFYNNHTLNINRCVQTKFYFGTGTRVEVSNSHFESLVSMPVIETLSDATGTVGTTNNIQVDFDNCYFTDYYTLECDKNYVTYTNCYFRVAEDATDKTIPLATVFKNYDYYNMECSIVDSLLYRMPMNTNKWKGYKEQAKLTRNFRNNTSNESTMSESIQATKAIGSGDYKYPQTGTYNYVGYTFNNSAEIAHERYEWTRTVSSLSSANDNSSAMLGLVGGWGFEIYRTLPDSTIQRARFYDSPVEENYKTVTNKQFAFRERGNYIIIHKWTIFSPSSDYIEEDFYIPWCTVSAIPSHTVNNQVYEKNGVLVTLDRSIISGLTNKPYAQVIDDYSKNVPHYSIMPSTAELFSLPNNTVFETDGFYTQKDGNGGKYLISAYQQGGCLTVTDGTTTKYLFALDNNGNMSKNYVDPTRFGVRAIDNINGTLTLENTYAEANSQIMSSIVAANMNATIRFPKGIFVFASPLDLSNRQYSLVGDDAPIPRTSALGYTGYDVGTLLCFPFLTNGQVAITMNAGNVENIAIYGNKDTYNITFDRTKAISSEVITETIAEDNGTQIKCTGLTKSSIGFIKNVYVFCFYKGMHLESNIYASNIYCRKCHTGIEALNDTKFVGVYGYDIYQLMYVNSILTSIVQLRVDSCFNALYLSRADKCTFIDIDGDWCTDSLVKAINVNYCVFEGIHGRCCTLKSYDSELMPNGYDVRTINDTNGYGIIRAVKLKNSRIVFNNGISRCFDSAQQGDLKYYIPNVVFTFPKGDNNVEVTDNQFVFNNTITSSDDILKVIQTKADVTIRIDTSSGTYYIEGTTAQEDNPSTNIDFSTLLGGE